MDLAIVISLNLSLAKALVDKNEKSAQKQVNQNVLKVKSDMFLQYI